MPQIKRITVFCGASGTPDEEYLKAARSLGEILAGSGVTLVYGGGKDGMAGNLASAALAAGGQVIGVMPRFLVEQGKAFEKLKDLRIANDLHAHKALMAELGDAFIGLPGGFGTLEEFFEILTWAQLGIHAKPCGLVNSGGYFDHLLRFMDHMCSKGYISRQARSLLITADSPGGLVEYFFKVVSETWSN